MKNAYLELISLTQLYLLQEYALDKRIYAESESYHYFKAMALKKQKPQPQAAPLLVPPISVVKEEVKVEVVEELPQPEVRMKDDFSDIRALVKERIPGLQIVDQIPQPQIQKPEILILMFNESGKQLDFLRNMEKAIQLAIAPAKLIQAGEEKKYLSGLKAVVACSSGVTSELKQSLGEVPLLLLPDLATYFKEPQLKATLWKTLKTISKKKQDTQDSQDKETGYS